MTAHGGQRGEGAEPDRDRRIAEVFEALRAQEQALHHETQHRDGERCYRQGQRPRSRRMNDRQCDVSAEEKIRAMRQVDDAHDAEDQRQSAADKKQQRAVGHAVEGLDHPELRIHFPPVPSSFTVEGCAELT